MGQLDLNSSEKSSKSSSHKKSSSSQDAIQSEIRNVLNLDPIFYKSRGLGTSLHNQWWPQSNLRSISAINKLEIDYNYAVKIITKNIIRKSPQSDVIDIGAHLLLSRFALGDYVTLDWNHSASIVNLITRIRDYALDDSKTRPLNIIMLAKPGSGKSYFIKCLTRILSSINIKSVTYNMGPIESIDDFLPPIDAVRNLKVNDKLPLLFLDEFDSYDSNIPILLPLLWDGQLQVAQRNLRVGKAVIILAGSRSRIKTGMKEAKEMREVPEDDSKLLDLLSRINGGEFHIPDLDLVEGNRNRKVDKICISAAILQNRFGSDLKTVLWALLSFIAHTNFRFGIRSISNLIEMIPRNAFEDGNLNKLKLNLPLTSVEKLKDSNLAYHLFSKDGPASVTTLWRTLIKHNCSIDLTISPDNYIKIMSKAL